MYNIRAKKSLSQNFILDPRLLNRIARHAGDLSGKTVIEVGPGPGGITRSILAQGPKEVHVIEKDPRFIPSLQLLREASGGVLNIHVGDCLNYNAEGQFKESLKKEWMDVPPDLHLVGNLPFNVATPFIVRLLSSMHSRSNVFSYGRVPLLLTFQHEVGHRMVAPNGDPERCRLSVMCQNYATVNYEFIIPGGAFVPAPLVDVAVMKFVPLKEPYIDLPFSFVEKVVTAIFRGKKKAVKNSAVHLFPRGHKKRLTYFLDGLFDLSGVDRTEQPYKLSMEDFERLCYAYKHMCETESGLENYVDRNVRNESLEFQVREEERKTETESSQTGFVFKF